MLNRYRLVQDNDCHWYVIPANNYPDFICWVDAQENDIDEFDEGIDYNKYRINCSPSLLTFENWRLEDVY